MPIKSTDRKHILIVPMRNMAGHSFLEEIFTGILPRRGWHVTWYVETPAGTEKAPCETTWKGTTVLKRPSVISWRNPLHTFFPVPAHPLREIISTGEYGVLHVRNDWHAAKSARSICREKGIPVVFQKSFPEEDFRAADIRMRGGGLKRLRILKTMVEKREAYKEIFKSDWILPISEEMKKDLAAQGGPAQRMTSFPLGFNCSVKPEEFDGGGILNRLQIKDKPVALYMGSMAALRRLDVTIKAFKIVTESIGDARLVMLGGDDYPDDRDAVVKLVNEMGISDRVVFHPNVSREEAYRFVRASSFTVSAIPAIDVYKVSSPTKVVESLALARPVIATELPEQARIIRESGAGIVVPFGEIALADAMKKLFADRSSCLKMGGAGRKYVEEHRDYNRMADAIEDIYSNLMRGASVLSSR